MATIFSAPRGTAANPVPSQFNPLIERIARLYLQSNGYIFTGEPDTFFRSRNPRVRGAIAFAITSMGVLEDWLLDESGQGLEDLSEFIFEEGEN